MSKAISKQEGATSAEKETVKVYLRVRPMTPKEKTSGPECVQIQSDKKIHFRNPKNIKKALEYEFDHVFGPEADQIQVQNGSRAQ